MTWYTSPWITGAEARTVERLRPLKDMRTFITVVVTSRHGPAGMP